MSADAKHLLEECIKLLSQGELTEARLRDLGSAITTNSAKQQHLLYLQTATTSVTSEVIGDADGQGWSGFGWPLRLCPLALPNRSGRNQRRLAGYPVPGSVTCWSHPRHTYHLRVHSRKMGVNQMTPEIQRATSGVKPTMTDQAVLDFCKTGLLSLEGIIPDATNRWVSEYPRPRKVPPRMRWSQISDTLRRYCCTRRSQEQHGRFSERISNCPTGWQTIASSDRRRQSSGMLTVVPALSDRVICSKFSISRNQTPKRWGPPYFCRVLTLFPLRGRN